MKRSLLCLVGCLFASSLWASSGGVLPAFERILPQVARGYAGGEFIETLIVLSNPNPAEVSANLTGFGVLLDVETLVLKPGETRVVELRDNGALQVGWVGVVAAQPLLASAHIIRKESEAASEATSQVTVLGQPLVGKASITVFAGAGSVSDQLETGVAIAVRQAGSLTLTLRDADGTEIGRRVLSASVRGNPRSDFTGHLSQFLEQLVPDVPEDFAFGSLTIEHEPAVPRAFAVTALYVRGRELTPAPTAEIDEPRSYFVGLEDGQPGSEVIQTLAEQYGLVVVDQFSDRRFLVSMTAEVAQVLARDPRVAEILPDTVIEFF